MTQEFTYENEAKITCPNCKHEISDEDHFIGHHFENGPDTENITCPKCSTLFECEMDCEIVHNYSTKLIVQDSREWKIIQGEQMFKAFLAELDLKIDTFKKNINECIKMYLKHNEYDANNLIRHSNIDNISVDYLLGK